MKFVWFVCCFWHHFIKCITREIYTQFILFSIYFCFECCLFVSQEHNRPRWERSISKWDANKVTHKPHKRLKMKREGDKGKERQGNLMGRWQPSCLIWKRLRFHGWGVVGSASGSGTQMDYSKSNHNTWIWDACRARERFLLFATFYVCPSSSVHHPSSYACHQSLPISASTD